MGYYVFDISFVLRYMLLCVIMRFRMPGKRKTTAQRDAAHASKRTRAAATTETTAQRDVASKRKRAAKTTDSDKRDIVTQVVNELQPFIEETIKNSLANIDSSDKAETSALTNDDEDLEVIFNDAKPNEHSQGEQSSAPLDLHLSPMIIAKIRGKKYVPLGQLIDSKQSSVNLNVSDNGAVIVEKGIKTPPITNTEQWFQAFLVYAHVYGECHPAEAVSMFEYMTLILNLANTFHIKAALKYDEDFRKLRSRSPDLRWDVLNQELYLIAASSVVQSRNVQQPFRPQAKTRPNKRFHPVPIGYCRKYNAVGQCSSPNCRYKHECFKCQGKHASTECNASDTRIAVRTRPGHTAPH